MEAVSRMNSFNRPEEPQNIEDFIGVLLSDRSMRKKQILLDNSFLQV
ncbi:hypothetical protein AALB39_08685 [Lachnospiraceae bacterium 54-53]